MIADNLKSVRDRIARSCEKVGRNIEDIELVCVTKEAGIAEIEKVLSLGVKDLGENRVKDASLKYNFFGDKARWHLVGHLQTNKVKDAVKIFSLIHSVDSIRLASEIDKQARKAKKLQDILIQVNTSGERTKFGLSPDEAVDFIKEVVLYSNININGLMTIAPEVDNPELVRPCFRTMKNLRDKINELRITSPSTTLRARPEPCRVTNYEPFDNAQGSSRALSRDGLRILSMGMTNDFEIAIEEGANMVRIGRAIFG